jgi:S-adenosylmethionine synthetase
LLRPSLLKTHHVGIRIWKQRLIGFCSALQQEVDGDEIELNRAVRSLLGDELERIAKAIPGFQPVLPNDLAVNGAGNFALGGPDGDKGLSRKKLVVDAYGRRVAIGGGALSGKDLFKADRAGAILARRIAKTVVLAQQRSAVPRWRYFPAIRSS